MKIVDNQDGTVTIQICNFKYLYALPGGDCTIIQPKTGEDPMATLYRVITASKKLEGPEPLWTLPRYFG